MRIPILAALTTALLAPTAAAQAPRAWWGEYQYEWSPGRTAGGTGIVVDYRLHLSADGCRITAQGWQTNETIRCAAQPSGGVININFVSYGDGSVRNVHGIQRYKPGERLFSLSNKHGAIWTGWGSYSPWENSEPLGKYFKRIGR